MNLKPLRVRFGLTQKELADRLGTTQQTIARWESGANAIPTKHLKDVAVLLGCPVSELLGIDETGSFKGRSADSENDSEDDTLLYGAVRLMFVAATGQPGRGSGDGASSYEWPISEAARGQLIQQLENRSGFGGEDGNKGWLSFETLDDRFVLANPNCLASVELVGDDAEAAPHYEHHEVYRAINLVLVNQHPSESELDSDTSPVSRQLIETAMRVIESWGGDDQAYERMNDLIIEEVSGARSTLHIEESNLNDILFGLLTDLTSSAEHRFGKLTSEGYHGATYYRYGNLRLIELSKSRWEDLMGEDGAVLTQDDTPAPMKAVARPKGGVAKHQARARIQPSGATRRPLKNGPCPVLLRQP